MKTLDQPLTLYLRSPHDIKSSARFKIFFHVSKTYLTETLSSKVVLMPLKLNAYFAACLYLRLIAVVQNFHDDQKCG